MADIIQPGSDTGLEVVIDVINASWDQANLKAAAYSAQIANASGVILDRDTAEVDNVNAGTVTVPVIAEPPMPPATIAEIFDDYTTEYLEIAAWLTTQFTTFITTYFPDENNAYQAMEDYLQAAIANPEVGMPQAIADQIWTDDRDRIIKDGARASAEMLAMFAAKGFALPPGAAASAALQIEQQTQDKISESSRKVAAMSVDLMKFNVESLLKLRDIAMKDAVDYIKALASAPEIASKMVNVGYDANAKLISSVSQYYNARTQANEVMSKVAQYNNTLEFEEQTKNQAKDLQLLEDQLKALLSEAQGIAQMATALYNNLHAQASVSTGASNSVQWQYQNDTQTAPPSTIDVR